MMTPSLFAQKTTLAPMREALSIQELAARLREDALAHARRRWGAHADTEVSVLLAQPAFLELFKHALASRVAETLARNDASVQAVYTYDPSMNPDSECGADLPVDLTLHLLVRTTQPSAALEALIASLDRALTEALGTLPSAEFAQRTSFLDVNLLSDEAAQRGTGYAALLSSLFAPPLRIW